MAETLPSTTAEEAALAGALPAGFGTQTGGAIPTGGFSSVGYIDSAIPMSQVRLRYDSAYGNNRPDRAEFFYPKCGCFRPGDPNAAGPPLAEPNVDYQEIRAYLEGAWSDRFSTFVEVPVRIINPQANDNTSGLGDVEFGLKYALVRNYNQTLSVQVRTFAPSGDGFKGLGTEHWSLEPALLYNRQVGDRVILEAELRDWTALDSDTDFAGNVLRYGVGVSYVFQPTCNLSVAPVVELVGWTVLNGLEFADVTRVEDATGDTIFNVKPGVRATLFNSIEAYIGYGRPLTGAVWYKDILRLELKYRY
jgi:hypothetical protein